MAVEVETVNLWDKWVSERGGFDGDGLRVGYLKRTGGGPSERCA